MTGKQGTSTLLSYKIFVQKRGSYKFFKRFKPANVLNQQKPVK